MAYAEEITDIEPEFYELIGRVVSDWSALELLVNDCIWAFSGVPFGFGACMTSQIYNIDARFRALVAAMRLRQAPETLIKKVNKFHENSRTAAQKRNRVVHDIWYLDETRSAAQLTITADKKLVFATQKKTLEDLREDHQTVEDALFKFLPIYEEIRSALASLPGTRSLALRASFQRHSPKKSPSKQ